LYPIPIPTQTIHILIILETRRGFIGLGGHCVSPLNPLNPLRGKKCSVPVKPLRGNKVPPLNPLRGEQSSPLKPPQGEHSLHFLRV